MRKVWSGEVVEYESEYLHWKGFKSHPTPLQKPFPVIIGGSKGKAFERIARYEALGVSRLLVPLPALAAGAGAIDGIRRFANELLSRLG